MGANPPASARPSSGESPPDDPLIGSHLGEYLVESHLGAGGMGLVYRGLQPVIGKPVAIKVLQADLAANPDEAQRLLTEARAVNAIRHRGIVDIFSFGRLPDGRHYLVMELLEGRPLDAVIADKAPIDPLALVAVLDEVLDALAAAHGTGVIHRDLKPNNIFIVTPQHGVPYVKLLDFGLAKQGLAGARATPQTRADMVVGTPHYMAPEQARGQPVSPATDIYAAGCLAFEMATGRPPFDAPSALEVVSLHLTAEAPRISSLVGGVSAELEDLVARMLEKDPARRPASAKLLRGELKRLKDLLQQERTKLHSDSARGGEWHNPSSSPLELLISAPTLRRQRVHEPGGDSGGSEPTVHRPAAPKAASGAARAADEVSFGATLKRPSAPHATSRDADELARSATLKRPSAAPGPVAVSQPRARGPAISSVVVHPDATAQELEPVADRQAHIATSKLAAAPSPPPGDADRAQLPAKAPRWVLPAAAAAALALVVGVVLLVGNGGGAGEQAGGGELPPPGTTDAPPPRAVTPATVVANPTLPPGGAAPPDTVVGNPTPPAGGAAPPDTTVPSPTPPPSTAVKVPPEGSPQDPRGTRPRPAGDRTRPGGGGTRVADAAPKTAPGAGTGDARADEELKARINRHLIRLRALEGGGKNVGKAQTLLRGIQAEADDAKTAAQRKSVAEDLLEWEKQYHR